MLKSARLHVVAHGRWFCQDELAAGMSRGKMVGQGKSLDYFFYTASGLDGQDESGCNLTAHFSELQCS